MIMPSDVTYACQRCFKKNYKAITSDEGRLLLFAADHKIEHLNADFFGQGIAAEAQDPEYLFKVASMMSKGVFATQLGLIARYAQAYPHINYLAKLNSKTDLRSTSQQEPYSAPLWTVDQVMQVKKNAGLSIVGVGCTVYLGSEYEDRMLSHAAKMISEAHAHGLVAVLWIYARGKAISDDRSADIIAGATGIANALGADFVKIKAPHENGQQHEHLARACAAGGNTGVICSGGQRVEIEKLLTLVHAQIMAGAAGCAIGRNIFQRPLDQARALLTALEALIYENKDLAYAIQAYSRVLANKK